MANPNNMAGLDSSLVSPDDNVTTPDNNMATRHNNNLASPDNNMTTPDNNMATPNNNNLASPDDNDKPDSYVMVDRPCSESSDGQMVDVEVMIWRLRSRARRQLAGFVASKGPPEQHSPNTRMLYRELEQDAIEVERIAAELEQNRKIRDAVLSDFEEIGDDEKDEARAEGCTIKK